MGTEQLMQLGRYRLVSELGRGAMGVVYRAIDSQLGREVAVKTIRMSSDSEEMAEYVARFRQEAKALGGLNHPGIITVYDAGSEGDVAYMAMELLEGAELRGLIAGSRLSLGQVVDLATQIAEALAFAHGKGVVHRDIKPANIMVLADNRAKIMDFGIARVRTSDVKTQTGLLLGSPKYMSPEQILGRPVDHRTDIFALGVVIYEMVAGTTPFSGADLTQLMHQVLNVSPPSLKRVNRGVPDLLDLTVVKAMEKAAEDRYQSAAEMASDLRLCKEALVEATRVLDRRDFQGETWPMDQAAAPQQRGAAEGAQTWVLKPPSDIQAPQAGERTLRLEPEAGASAVERTVAAPQAGAAVDAALTPSSGFPSEIALRRLTRPSAEDRALLAPDRAARGTLRDWMRDTDFTIAVAAIAGGAAVAVLLMIV